MTRVNKPMMSSPVIMMGELLELDEVKLFLRIDNDYEDELLNQLIISARVAAENYLKKTLVLSRLKACYLLQLPSKFALPSNPVKYIEEIVVGTGQAAKTLTKDQYHLQDDHNTLLLDFAIFAHQVNIEYVAGFERADLPPPIRQGMLIHINSLYESRMGNVSMPRSATELYQPYRAMEI